MSASKNKKQRLNAPVNTVKAEEEAKRAKENKKYKAVGIAVAVLFVLAVVFILLFNTIMYNWLPAVSVNGRNYSAAEFNFFYFTEYNRLSYTSSSNMPTSGYSFKEQSYDDTMSWYDYLKNNAENTLTQYTAIYNEAKAKGYELTEEDKTAVDEEMASLKERITSSGASSKAYLENIYGPGMSESVYRKCYEFYTYVNSYYSHVIDTFEHTDAELAAEYAELANDYDYLSFDLFFVEADTGTDEEPIALADAMSAAKDEAEEIKAATADEESFVAAVQDYYNLHSADGAVTTADADTLRRDLPGRYVSSYYSWLTDWLLDSSRSAGDVETFSIGGTEDDTSNGYYVVLWLDRDENDYDAAKATLIAVTAEELTKGENETDEEFAARQEAAQQAAVETTLKIQSSWDNNEYATTDELIEAYADSIYYNQDYDDLSRHDLYDVFNDWLFSDERQEGDSTTITYGSYEYVLIYKGRGENLQKIYAKNSLTTKEFNAWAETVADGYEVKEHWALRYTGGIYYENYQY